MDILSRAGLMSMVVNYTIGKKEYKEVEEKFKELKIDLAIAVVFVPIEKFQKPGRV